MNKNKIYLPFSILFFLININLFSQALEWKEGKTESKIPYILAITNIEINKIKTPLEIYIQYDKMDDGVSHGTIQFNIKISNTKSFKEFNFSEYESLPDGDEKKFKIKLKHLVKKNLSNYSFTPNLSILDHNNIQNSPIEISVWQITKDKGELKSLIHSLAKEAGEMQVELIDSKNPKLKLEFNFSLKGIEPLLNRLIKKK